MLQRVALCSVLCLAACSEETPAGSGCLANDDCAAGQVCLAGACANVCSSDTHCPPQQICRSSSCIAGNRPQPVIGAIDGDGDAICPDAAGTHCVATGLVVTGSNLEGAAYSIRPARGGAAIELTASAASDTRAELALPADVESGDWVLTAVNQSGSGDQTFTLIQGPAGPDKTPDELVDSINLATRRIALARLPVGATSADVASGVHAHAAADISSGVLATARLPIGSASGNVAAGDHTHAQYLMSGAAGTSRLWSASRTAGVASTSWTTIPGMSLTVDLTRAASVRLSATGELRALAVDAGNCHQAFRFVVGGNALGDGSHGQRIHVLRRDAGWWAMWSFDHVLSLPTGQHTISVQTRESGNASAMCRVCAELDGATTGYSDCSLNALAVYD